MYKVLVRERKLIIRSGVSYPSRHMRPQAKADVLVKKRNGMSALV
jgi:hypothetical protein